MKNQTVQIQMGCISKIARVFLFLMMMLFVEGSMAQTGEAGINNTSSPSDLQSIISSDSLNFINLQTGHNYSVSKNSASYLWRVPTGVTILSAQGTNAIIEGAGTVTPLAGAPSYTWTVGSGTLITSGQDTTPIIVNPGDNNGQIKCTKNSCGSRAAAKLAGREAINQ